MSKVFWISKAKSGNSSENTKLLLDYNVRLLSSLTKLFISGIILNLTVVISIREKESLMNNTVNVVLGNLCFANLIEAVFVKTIAVVYHGYAVARSRYNQGLYQKLPIHDLNHFHYFFFACQIFVIYYLTLTLLFITT